MTVWDREPVLVSLVVALSGSTALWAAFFPVLAAFGHPLTPQQQTALLGFLTTLGALVGGLVGRSQVSPTSGATTATVNLQNVGKL